MELYTHQNVDNSEERRDDAKRTIKSGVALIGDILKSTLGPRGSMKILQGRETAVTNDGAFILKNLLIDSASARIIANSSINQDLEEGDGTTSIAVLASLVLSEAYATTVHPANISRGISLGLARALDVLGKRRFEPKPEDIKNLVRTTLNSKILSNCLDLFVDICIRAVDGADDIGLIGIIKLEGDLDESILVDGLVLDKPVDVDIESPRVLVANTALDFDKIKIFSSKISVNCISELEKIEAAEKEKMRTKIDAIASIPYDLFVNRQLIYDYPMQLLRNRGLAVIEHADFGGIERLNKVLGGNIISSFDNLSSADLGSCARVQTVCIKGRKMVRFEGVRTGARSIVLCGSSKEVLDEAERSVHDALCVLKRIRERPACVYGGGSIEMTLATELFKYALEIKSKDAEGVECLARALQQIPVILAENCGFDGNELRASLKNDHSYRRSTYGVNVTNGKSSCMRERGVVEGYEMKKRVLTAACETAQTILKCDGIVKCKPRERHRH
ncbi:T-complex protein 1 subunit beta [Pancytospora philotis]|nr:T-complex protein 1 subunit beta [Pancytospora philotis]